MLFTNNSGQDAVNQIFKFNQEQEDRKLREAQGNQAMRMEQKKMDMQANMYATDQQNRASDIASEREFKAQEGQYNRQTQYDLAGMAAGDREVARQDKFMEMQLEQQNKLDSLNQQRERDDRSYNIDQAKLAQEQQKINQDAQFRQMTADTNKQNANTQSQAVQAGLIKLAGIQEPGLDAKSVRVGLDGSPMYQLPQQSNTIFDAEKPNTWTLQSQ